MKEFARNTTTVVSSRVSKKNAERLQDLAKSRNLPMSMLLRVVLYEFLSGRSGIRLPLLIKLMVAYASGLKKS
jgi:hypothetical protein